MVDDIFKDDPRFKETEKKRSDDGILSGFSNLLGGFKNIFVGFFQIFAKRMPMNLFFLLIIISMVFFGAQFIKKPQITGAVIIKNTTCPEIICPKQECLCPDINYSKCPQANATIEKVNVIYYKCPSGTIVNNSDECGKYPVNLTSESNAIANNAILSLDGLNFTKQEAYQSINRMNVTVSNLDNTPIMPEIHIKLYEKWNSEIANEGPLRRIKFDDILKFNEVVSKSEHMVLDIDKLPITIRLELFDTLPDPDKSLAIVTKEIKSIPLS